MQHHTVIGHRFQAVEHVTHIECDLNGLALKADRVVLKTAYVPLVFHQISHFIDAMILGCEFYCPACFYFLISKY